MLARVRAQLRLKHTQDEVRKQARIAEESQATAHTAFHALAVTEKISRFAFSFSRAMKMGAVALFFVGATMSGVFFVLYHRTQRETKHAYAAIAQPERNARKEQDLIEPARRMREAEQSVANSIEPQRPKLAQQSGIGDNEELVGKRSVDGEIREHSASPQEGPRYWAISGKPEYVKAACDASLKGLAVSLSID